jgi:hypothetical protein
MTAAMLKDIGVSKDRAIELLNEHYNVPDKCEPQWDVCEGPTADRLDVKVENAWAYLNQTQPGSRSPQADFGDEPVDAAALDATVQWWEDRRIGVKPQRVTNAVRVGGIWYRRLRDGTLQRIKS